MLDQTKVLAPQMVIAMGSALPYFSSFLSLFVESFRLEKTLKIIESNCKPSTAKSATKSCP